MRGTCMIVCVMGVLLAGTVSATSDFESFADREMADFVAFDTAEAEAFARYDAALESAWKAYRTAVSRVWGKADISGKKVWVEYGDDYREKRKVDFEKGEVSLSVVMEEGDAEAEARFEKMLVDLIQEDTETATKRDPVASAVEGKAADAVPGPVAGDLLVDRLPKSKKEAKAAARKILKKAKRVKALTPRTGKKTLTVKIPVKKSRLDRRTDAVKENVIAHARRQKIDPALVMAVIHTESAFNPMATSPVPAFGLMQIVPKSAGLDATALLGKKRLLSPAELYRSQTNIEVGCAYLHVLYYRYLKAIRNPESRLYCAIAAYNTGAGNVARAFTGNRNINTAARTINSMTPATVKARLLKELPYKETRHYLERVTRRLSLYGNMTSTL